MNREVLQQLVQTAARRQLTPREQADWEQALRNFPAERATWAEEMRLSRALGALPPAPVPSNFVNRVLAALDTEKRPTKVGADGPKAWTWLRLRWPAAVASLAVLLLAVVGVQHQQRVAAREEVVRSMQTFVATTEVPSVEMLQDFDLILSLPEGPIPAVEELASALQ